MIHNIKTQQEQIKGWLIGQFLEGDIKDTNIEIYCKEFKIGDTSDKLHLHPVGKEYLFVISGEILFRAGDNNVVLKDGDYLAMEAGTPDQILEVRKKTVLFGVRYPSIPNNKTFLDER